MRKGTSGLYGSLAVTFAFLALLSGTARATSIRVSQEATAGAGDWVKLGTIDPYVTADTASGYYNYNASGNYSFNGPEPTLHTNYSHLFFVEASDGLSLFTVHGPVSEGERARPGMEFSLAGDTAEIRVYDDWSGGSDDYTDSGTSFTSDQISWPGLTDGLAIGALDGMGWDMTASFTSFVRLQEWGAFSSSGSTIDLALEEGRRVRLQPIPEPSTLALVALAGVGLIVIRRLTRV